MKCWGVVPAAGRGARMNGDVPKQYRLLGGVSVLDRSVAALLGHPAMQAVMVALSPADDRWSESRCADDARVLTCTGGDSRAASVYNALQALAGIAGDDDWVAVHDAVRPCLRGADLARLLDEAAGEPAGAVLVAPISDTVKQVAGDYIERTLDRARVVRAVTPQVFRCRLLREALAGALADGAAPTDEAAAMERAGHRVRAVAGDAGNVKITWPGDLRRAENNLETGDTQ